MEIIATLLTDLPLDERHFYGLLQDLASTGLAGTIEPCGLQAQHELGGNASSAFGTSSAATIVRVQVKEASLLSPRLLDQLHKLGFRARQALEFRGNNHLDAPQDPWPLIIQYARELRGWIHTDDSKFLQTLKQDGFGDCIFSLPAEDHLKKSTAVLISTIAMKQLPRE